jgi:hypothetical protein
MIGVGVTVGVGVSEGVAGTGVNVARRVAVGLGVWVGAAVTSTPRVGAGGRRMRPQPLNTRVHNITTRVHDITSQTAGTARCGTLPTHRISVLLKGPLPRLASAAAGQIVAKEGVKVKRYL